MAPDKQFVKENKLVSVLGTVIASGLITWGAWVTLGVQDSKHPQMAKGKTIEALCLDVEELKDEVGIIKREARVLETTLTEKMEDNHKEIMRYLIGIKTGLWK